MILLRGRSRGFADRRHDLKIRRQSSSKTPTADRNWQKKEAPFCDAMAWKCDSSIFLKETGYRPAKKQAKKRNQDPSWKAYVISVRKARKLSGLSTNARPTVEFLSPLSAKIMAGNFPPFTVFLQLPHSSRPLGFVFMFFFFLFSFTVCFLSKWLQTEYEGNTSISSRSCSCLRKWK